MDRDSSDKVVIVVWSSANLIREFLTYPVTGETERTGEGTETRFGLNEAPCPKTDLRR